MDRGVFESSLVQQMMEGSPTWWWSMNNNMRPPPQPAFPLLPSSSSWSSSSSSAFPQHPQPSDIPMATASCQDSQELPDSWCHLFLGGLVGEEEESGLTPFQTKKIENCKDQVYLSATAHMADIKQEYFGSGYVHGHGNEEIHDSKSTWNHVLPASNSNSCITTSFSSNMLDFSNKAHNQPDNSSECNSIETAPAFKKARIQGSSPPKSTLKVRKEKLGDRITALHQLVSPFGKTDTASVLLEAIGYIRFLQSQIEALSSPYVGNGSRNMKQPAQENMRLEDPGQFLNESGMKKPQDQQERNDEETKKDLRSRGLCLVPLSVITMHVGSDTGADSWAPITPGGDFQ